MLIGKRFLVLVFLTSDSIRNFQTGIFGQLQVTFPENQPADAIKKNAVDDLIQNTMPPIIVRLPDCYLLVYKEEINPRNCLTSKHCKDILNNITPYHEKWLV